MAPPEVRGRHVRPPERSHKTAGAPEGTLPPRRRAVDFWWGLGSLAAYIGLAFAVYWDVWTSHPTTTTIGGPDSYLVSWFLAYMGQAVVHAHNPFYTTFGNYPYGVNLLANSSSPALGFIGTPISLAFGGVATFNVMTTASLAASAGTAYLLVRRFVSWHPAAFLAGLLYGFSPYMIIESADGHLQMAFAALPPLIFLVLHDIVVRRPDRWLRNGILLAVLAVVQFFISEEVLATTAMIAVVVLVGAAICGRRGLRARSVAPAKAIGLGAVVAICALAYPTWYGLKGPGHITGAIMPVAEAFRADLAGFILPTSVQRLAPTGHLLTIAQSLANGPGENSSYLGIPLIVVLVVGVVWLRRQARIVVVALGAVVAAILSLGGALAVYKAPQIGPNGDATGKIPLPEALLHKIGPLQSLIPVRFSLYVVLGAGIILAVVVERCHDAWRTRWNALGGTAGALVVAVVALVPLVPVAPLNAAAPIGLPQYFVSQVHRSVPAGSVALIYPYPSGATSEPEAWLAFANLPFLTPGGYFLVPGPTGHEVTSGQAGYTRTTPLGDWLNALRAGTPRPRTTAWRLLLRQQLRALHIRTVIAVPGDGANPAAALADLKWLLGPPSARQGGTVDWYGVPGTG